HAHGVIEIGAAHFFFETDRERFSGEYFHMGYKILLDLNCIELWKQNVFNFSMLPLTKPLRINIDFLSLF
ncbi:MAG: hypothetical protein ABFC42_07495, partial [Sulfuricella sp.]